MGAITMRLGKVSGPLGALKVWGVKSRLMGRVVGVFWRCSTRWWLIFMENREDAYPLGDMTPVTPE
jgi:hypothetical protein